MEEYRVVTVLPLGKKKYKITLEGTEIVVLSLYPSEVRRYSLKEGNTLLEKDLKDIYEILFKRGKERALYYLKSSDKTVYQMRTKLKEGYYPYDIIDKIIEFLEKYGYLDDYRYAENFISYNKHRKSVQKMKNDLMIKGIEKNVIDDAFAEFIEDNEKIEGTLIEEFCRKRIKLDMDEKGYNKLLMSLMRKGFKYEQVKSVLRKIAEETTT